MDHEAVGKALKLMDTRISLVEGAQLYKIRSILAEHYPESPTLCSCNFSGRWLDHIMEIISKVYVDGRAHIEKPQ